MLINFENEHLQISFWKSPCLRAQAPDFEEEKNREKVMLSLRVETAQTLETKKRKIAWGEKLLQTKYSR